MKKLVSLVIFSTIVLSVLPVAQAEQQVATRVATLQIPGLTAAKEAKVEQTLKVIPGVFQVKASSSIQGAVIVYDPLKVQKDQFIQRVKDAGYLASFAKANYRCPHCKATYERNGKCIVCDIPLEPIPKS